MEPPSHATPTTSPGLRLAGALAVVVVGLGGCGSGTTEPGASAQPSQQPSQQPTREPSTEPSTYPAFEPGDYAYTLAVTCFCLNSGTPVRVVVAGDEVVSATYLQDATGRGTAQAGDPAEAYLRLSIDDIIDLANDTEAFRVEVDWPPGQAAGRAYPTSVVVDEEERVADDERTYRLSESNSQDLWTAWSRDLLLLS